MQYLPSYLSTAKKILERYKGEIPFNLFLKKFFSTEKKYGSRDRKIIASLCFNYFRIANCLSKKEIEKGLITGVYLFTNTQNEFLLNYNKEWNDSITLPIEQKAALAGLSIGKLFPFNHELSADIDLVQFNLSFLQQPDLFIRIRPGKKSVVKQKLDVSNIPFKEISHNCLAFSNGTKLDDILEINKDAVIQDLSSQNVGNLFKLMDLPAKPLIWDCCAASGGKSIMGYDYFPDNILTVSDIRSSIIQNLKTRLNEAGVKQYTSFIADLTNLSEVTARIGEQKFDLIICDAPCSGSGTWGRTPEQLLFFKETEINKYSTLQKKIVQNILLQLKKGGYLLYITCSVFKKENEEVSDFILQNSNFQLLYQQLLKGYNDKADSMYVSLFVGS